MIRKIVCFDFDKTLCFTPEPEEGKKIWFEKTGMNFPHDGWWSKPETLNTDIFYIPTNPWVLERYKEARKDPEAYVVLVTGRLARLQKKVEKVIEFHGLDFDEILCCDGGGTYPFKCRTFERLISEFKPNVFTAYDDRHEHLVRFINEWAPRQPCRVEFIDVTKSDKTPVVINKTKVKFG